MLHSSAESSEAPPQSTVRLECMALTTEDRDRLTELCGDDSIETIAHVLELGNQAPRTPGEEAD